MTSKDVVLKFFACYAAGDLEGAAQWMSDDITHRAHAENKTDLFCGRYDGKDAAFQRLHEIAVRFLIETYDLENVIAEGNRVAALTRIVATAIKTGAHFETRTAVFATVTDGLITDIEEIFDTALVSAVAGDAAPTAIQFT